MNCPIKTHPGANFNFRERRAPPLNAARPDPRREVGGMSPLPLQETLLDDLVISLLPPPLAEQRAAR